MKTLTPGEVAATGARIVLGNTYHLWLRPGAESVAAHGGRPPSVARRQSPAVRTTSL